MTAPTQTLSGAPADAPDLLVETRRAIAWDAVIAGALVGLAVTICLSIAGAALGFSMVDAYEPGSAKTVSIGALIWLFVVNIVGMSVGGYIAGRGCLTETTMDVADFRFRCATHGLTVWAIATVAAAVLGLSAVASAIGMAGHATSMALGGQAGHAMTANDDDDDTSDIGFHVRQLFGTERAPGQGQSTQPAPAPSQPGTPSRAEAVADYGDDAMDEAGHILARAWGRNGLAASEKTYLAGLLARHNGISPADADKRVGEAEQRLKAAMAESDKAMKEAAEKAARASALAALFAFLSLGIGAVAAVAGALSSNTGRTRIVFK